MTAMQTTIVAALIAIGSAGITGTAAAAVPADLTAYTTDLPAGPPQVVNAKNIGDDYESNKIAAAQKWGGKYVQFTSKVLNISDGWGGPSVSFGDVTSKAFSFTQIVCNVGDANQLVSIAKEHPATVRGVIDGDQTMGVISVKDCQVVG